MVAHLSSPGIFFLAEKDTPLPAKLDESIQREFESLADRK